MNVNENLKEVEKNQLIDILQEHYFDFPWEYNNMRGIGPETCIHHIYIKHNARLVRQPQQINLKEIVAEL